MTDTPTTSSSQLEQIFSALIESSQDTIYSRDLDGMITFWNKGAEQLLGYSAEEIVGRHISVLMPDDRIEQERQVMDRLNHGESIGQYESIRLRKDGTPIEVAISVSPMKDRQGRVTGAAKILRDLTRERRTEEELHKNVVALRESEARYGALFETMEEGFCVIDVLFDQEDNPVDYRFLEVNPAFERQTGLHNAVGKRMRELAPAHEKHWFEIYGKVAKTGRPIRFINEARALHRWFDVNAFKVGNPSENKVALLFIDITPRRAAEEAMRESEQHFRAAFEQAAIGIAHTGPDGRWIRINSKLAEMLGYTREELLKKSYVDITHPDDIPSSLAISRRLLHGEISSCSIEKRYIRKDGQVMWAQVTISAIRDRNDETLYNFVAVRDITERKHTEEMLRETRQKLQLAIEGSDLGAWDWNVITGELVWSERCKQLFGVPTDQPVTYDTFLQALHPDDRARADTAVQNALRTGDVYLLECRTIWPDGQERWILTRGRAFYDHHGKAVRMTGTATDITSRKLTEQRLHEAQQKLSDLNKHLEGVVEERTAKLRETVSELESFAYTVSHDLRSPLRAMQAFAYMTLDEYGDKMDENGRDYLKRIDSAARRMDGLIQDVLAYNRVARAELRIEPVNLENVIDEVIQDYPSVNQPHASFDIRRPLHRVMGSPAALVQVFSNLLTNAVKFVGAGQEAEVKVYSERRGDKVRLVVEDNGIGIPAEAMPKIYEPFQRGHVGEGYAGTGIGLAIVKKAVDRMSGTMGVESTVGKGSTFWIELPAAP